MPDLTDEQWLTRLDVRHRRELPELVNLNRHYEGSQQLAYLHPELLAELEDRVQQVVINWPELVIDSLAERLTLQWFRIAGKARPDDGLWEIWQLNDLDEYSRLAHVDALVMRRAYVIVGARGESTTQDDATQGDADEAAVPADIPLITVESPLEVYAEHDPRTGRVVAARKCWKEEAPGSPPVEHATLYLPNETRWYVRNSGAWVPDDAYEPDQHGLGVVPVVPLVNRPRTGSRGGRSELASILPMSNAANKTATDMMVSAEYHAMPRRVAFGFGEEDFVDEQGRRVSSWSRIIGRIWATQRNRKTGPGGDGADVIQFPEADLRNFHETINLLAHLVSSLGAVPPSFMGFATDNPASADAIRASEARLVKRAEDRQQTFGNSWERVMRLADRIKTGRWRPELRMLESRWRNASTPTVAQTADAAVKLHAAGITPLRQTRVDIGYNQEEILLMEEEDVAAADREAERLGFKSAATPEPDEDEDEAGRRASALNGSAA